MGLHLNVSGKMCLWIEYAGMTKKIPEGDEITPVRNHRGPFFLNFAAGFPLRSALSGRFASLSFRLCR